MFLWGWSLGECVYEGRRGKEQEVEEERGIRVEGKGKEDSCYVEEKVDSKSEGRSRLEK